MHAEAFGVFTVFFVIVLLITASDSVLRRMTEDRRIGRLGSVVTHASAWVGIALSIAMTFGGTGIVATTGLGVVGVVCLIATLGTLCRLTMRHPSRG